MNCDCIERIEKKLNQALIAANPGCKVVESASFANKVIRLKSGDYVLGNPVMGKVKKGKSIKKFGTLVSPHFCPFCGKSLEEGGEA